MTNLVPPTYLGLPEKFTQWRIHQAQACEIMTDDEPRFLLAVCPTGFGKSLTYLTAAMLREGRTVVLTSTKGLQGQLLADFGDMPEVADIRGRANYTCRLNTKVNCEMGLCAFGVRCNMRDEGGCFYFDAVRRAKRAKVVITNYAYWMSQNEYAEGLGEFEMLVLDEAHAAPDHLIDHVSVRFSKFSKFESNELGLSNELPDTVEGWQLWAAQQRAKAELAKVSAKADRKEKRFIAYKRLVKKLDRVVDAIDDTWVWENTADAVTLTPIWAKRYAEVRLFCGVPRVVLTSATVVAKTADLLGIAGNTMDVREFPHAFPVDNRPLTHIPTISMNHRVTPDQDKVWLTKLDQIMRPRLKYKGVVHTVSYKRRDLVMEHSKLSDHMVTHQRRDTESVVRAFKQAPAPMILVSPSMATGWDFPDDECRWQVIVKLPYPDTRGAVIRARTQDDKDFTAYIVMQQLIQATGRGVRSEDDWCETFITDNNVTGFLQRNEHLLVNWFIGAYRVSKTIPRIGR